jgi:peptidoglycan/xylan/chitin deacetylase (PgdA/CDA1 family)
MLYYLIFSNLPFWSLIASLVGLSFGLTIFFQPRWLLSIAELIIPGVIYFVETNQPVVALTIDDGPDSITTPKILEILSQHQASATFFLISSRIEGNESLVSELVNQGHELGNHLTKDEPSIQLSPAEFETALLEAHQAISSFAEPHWLRPASGWYNARMLKTAHEHSYRVALGDVFPYDTNISSSWFATNHILFNVRSGSIIILHDGGVRGEITASTLAKTLPELHRRGFQVVTLSELFRIADRA